MTAPTHGAVLDAESVKALTKAQMAALRYMARDDYVSGADGNPSLTKCILAELGLCTITEVYGRPGFYGVRITDLGRAVLADKDRLARPTPEGEDDGAENAVGWRGATPPAQPEPCFECGSTERIGEACRPCNPELAQPEPGAGELEVVGYTNAENYALLCKHGHGAATVWPTDHGKSTPHRLADHTQAQAKIARLEGEVAERDEVIAAEREDHDLTRKQLTDAEADAAKVSPLLDEARDAIDFFDRVKAASEEERIAVGHDHWGRMEAALRALAALAAQTERRA